MVLEEKIFTEAVNDCYFKAFITNLGKYNEGELVGQWVDFPIDEDDFNEKLKEIGIGSTDEFGQPYEEWFVTDYDCSLDGFDWQDLGEYPSYERLEEFGELVAQCDNSEAVNDAYEVTGDLEEAINGLDNGDIVFYSGIDSYAELAEVIIDEMGGVEELDSDTIERYFDYEQLGRELDFDTYEGDPEPTGDVVITVSDIEVYNEEEDEYEVKDDFTFTIEVPDEAKKRINGTLEDELDVDDDVIERIAKQEIANKYNVAEDNVECTVDFELKMSDGYQTAGEYFCGDENASDYDIGIAFVDDVGMDGVGNPQYYFDYDSYGRDLSYDGFTLTTHGCIWYR